MGRHLRVNLFNQRLASLIVGSVLTSLNPKTRARSQKLNCELQALAVSPKALQKNGPTVSAFLPLGAASSRF